MERSLEELIPQLPDAKELRIPAEIHHRLADLKKDLQSKNTRRLRHSQSFFWENRLIRQWMEKYIYDNNTEETLHYTLLLCCISCFSWLATTEKEPTRQEEYVATGEKLQKRKEQMREKLPRIHE